METSIAIGNDSASLICVLYDTPNPGQSTWYYTLVSGSSPAISHFSFSIGACATILESGTWGPTTGDLNAGAGTPVIGTDPTTGITGIKFDLGFADGESRNYYFVMDGNYAVEPIAVASKGGPGFDAGMLCGPSGSCDPICPATCEPPTGLTITYLSPSKVMIDWPADPCAMGWQICGHDATGASMCHIRPVPSKKLNGLSPGNTYNVYVRKKCTDGSISDWSDTLTFTMPVPRIGESTISVYPNPATQQLFVDVIADNVNWSVHDLTGRMVLQGSASSIDRLQVDVSELPEGTYIIDVNSSKTTFTIVK